VDDGRHGRGDGCVDELVDDAVDGMVDDVVYDMGSTAVALAGELVHLLERGRGVVADLVVDGAADLALGVVRGDMTKDVGWDDKAGGWM